MWLTHWRLLRDPFHRRAVEPIETAPLRDGASALARMVDAGEPWGMLGGESGVGKSVCLRAVLSRVRSPKRRVAFATAEDAESTVSRLAEALGGSDVRPGLGRIEGALRTLRLQGISVAIGLDATEAPADPTLLARLRGLASASNGGLTVLSVLRPDEEPRPTGAPVHRMRPLGRSEAVEYVGIKLRRAGAETSPFSAAALARLHAEAHGLPAMLDRLASLCLRLGADQGEPEVSARLVEAATAEIEGGRGLFQLI